MIKIDHETIEKLDRFAGIHARIDRLVAQRRSCEWVNLFTTEYHQLQKELNQEFFPLINRLVEAGLISISVDLDGKSLKSCADTNYRFSGSVVDVHRTEFKDGSENIFIRAGKVYGVPLDPREQD